MFVPISVIVTVAPGTAPDDVSVMVPSSVPRVACAAAGDAMAIVSRLTRPIAMRTAAIRRETCAIAYSSFANEAEQTPLLVAKPGVTSLSSPPTTEETNLLCVPEVTPQAQQRQDQQKMAAGSSGWRFSALDLIFVFGFDWFYH